VPIVHPTIDSSEELDQLLAWPGPDGPINRVQIERSATGGGVGFSNIGSITLVAGSLYYDFHDGAGTASDWYRWYPSNAANTFPVPGSRDYSDELQPSDTGGFLCDVGDVEQELGGSLSTAEKEAVLDKIRQVSTTIERITGRWFTPRPVSGTATYRLHTSGRGNVIRFSKGVRSLATLGIGTGDQIATGGTYTTLASTSYYLDPPELDREDGQPAFAIRLIGGARLYTATFGLEVTGAFGYARVPYDIKGVAVRAVIRRHIGKGGGGTAVAIGPNGTEFLLPDMSGSDREVIQSYSVMAL
jgi:hypothetical protein